MNQIAEFNELKHAIQVFVEPTKEIKVRDEATDMTASTALRTVKDYQKRIELKRKALVEPLNEQVKAINAAAKEILSPLDAAETHIKNERGRWAGEQRVIQVEAARKLEAERVDKLRLADLERRKLEAEQIKQREAERLRLKQEQESLAELGVQVDDSAMKKKEQEIAEREAIQRAEHESKVQREQLEMRQREKLLEASKPKNIRQDRKVRVVNPDLVPDKYWVINEAMVSEDMLKRAVIVPGCEIYTVDIVVAR